MKTYLSEIFSSVQGEGPYVGERHLFVRFCGCHRDCIFCDTPVDKSENVMVEKVPGSGTFEPVPNPLAVGQMMEIIREMESGKTNRRISLTGGEPLLQAHYLRELLPLLSGDDHSIYLETAGDLPQQLKSIIAWIDIVAMDVKLSSVTKEKSTFPAHGEFLKTCRDWDVEVFTKLILSAETNEAELMEAVQGIRKAGGEETMVVIQPVTPAEKTDAVPSVRQLLGWQEMVGRILPNVRVIPQMHKMMEMR
jgi:organic radical activating enzyme